MSRDTVSSVTSANAGTAINWAMLAQVSLSASVLYACTGNRFLFDGVNTYSPVGGLGGVDPVIEEPTLFPRSVKLWISAVGSANLYEPMNENLFNKTVKLYRAALDGSLNIIGTPQLCLHGYIDGVNVTLNDSQRGNFFEIEVESRIRREAASNYYTTENHDQMLQGVYSGDTIFKYVPRIIGFTSQWGGQNQTLEGTPTRGPGAGSGGGGGRGGGR